MYTSPRFSLDLSSVRPPIQSVTRKHFVAVRRLERGFDHTTTVPRLTASGAIPLPNFCVITECNRHPYPCFVPLNIVFGTLVLGAPGGAVAWDTALQAGRSRVWFPLVQIWSWGWLNLWQKWVTGIFSGVKAAGAKAWQLYHLHVSIVLKSGSLRLL